MLDLSKLYIVVTKCGSGPLSSCSLHAIGPFSSRKEGEKWLREKGWVEKMRMSGTWFLPRSRSHYQNISEGDERAVVEEIFSINHPSFNWPKKSSRD